MFEPTATLQLSTSLFVGSAKFVYETGAKPTRTQPTRTQLTGTVWIVALIASELIASELTTHRFALCRIALLDGFEVPRFGNSVGFLSPETGGKVRNRCAGARSENAGETQRVLQFKEETPSMMSFHWIHPPLSTQRAKSLEA